MKQTLAQNTDNNSKSQFPKKSSGSNSSKWQVKKLGELCEIEWKRGSGLRKSDLDENGENQCILYGELYTKHKNVLIENNAISRTNKIGTISSKKGDILVPGTSTAAKQDMLLAREIDEDGVFLGGDINIIRPKQGIFAQKYLPYFFETETAFDQLDRYITGATGIIHISNTGLKQLNIPLPPLAEQKRIVAILDQTFSEVEKVKANTEQNLKNAKEIFESYLQGVFENKGDDWEEKIIKEVCELKSGTTISTNLERSKGDVLYIKVGDMTLPENEIEINTSSRFVNSNEIKFNQIIPSGAIIFPKRGGAIATNKKRKIVKPTIVDLNTMAIIPGDKIDTNYFFHWFALIDLNDISNGTSIPQINNYSFDDVKISFPKSKIEQQTIVRQLDALRSETQKLEEIYTQKLSDLEELKKSLLQKAFAGELVK